MSTRDEISNETSSNEPIHSEVKEKLDRLYSRIYGKDPGDPETRLRVSPLFQLTHPSRVDNLVTVLR